MPYPPNDRLVFAAEERYPSVGKGPMKFCSTCGASVGWRVRYCSICGKSLAAGPLPETAESAPSPSKIWPIIGGGGVVVLLALFSIAFVLAPVGPSKTRSQSTPATPTSAQVFAPGDVAAIAQTRGYWPCGSSKEALDRMTSFALRGDEAGVKRAMRSTGSIGLPSGLKGSSARLWRLPVQREKNSRRG